MAALEPLTLNHPLDEAAIAAAAERDRLTAFNERCIVGAASALAGVALTVWILSAAVGWQPAAGWGGAMLLVETAILLAGLRCRRALAGHGDVATWRNAQFVLAGLAGAMWGGAVWVGWGGSDMLMYMLVLMVVVAVAGISMLTMAAYTRASCAYFLAINLVPLLHLVTHDVPNGHMMAVGLLVGLVVQLGYCHEIRQVVLRDASQNARNTALVNQLNNLVMHDQLTGAFSRRYVFEQMEQAVSARQRHGACAALVMFDLDHFKSINDTHGHPAGDRALREVVRAVGSRLRSGDVLGRVGGEEFLIVLPATSAEAAAQLAEQLRQLLADTAIEEGHARVVLPASFGVAELQSAESHSAWFRRVDHALYQAKAQGRNRVVVAD
jgi:diguanylate cyclase (GGDEF)-like protein